MPKVSVLMPVYNAEKFVEFTLNSLLNQTFTDFEIIAINDGSTDNSADILAKYAQKDKRIRIINQENRGIAGARNSALEHINGEYFYFCDADDVCHPQLLEFMLRAAENEKADMAICKFETVTDNINITHQVYNFPDKYEVIDHPIEYFCTHKKNYGVTVWTKLYKTSALDGLTFKHGMNVAEDVYFNLHAANRIKKAVFLPVPLYYYYLSEGSISRNGLSITKLEQHILFYELVRKDFSAQPKIWELIQKYICNRSYFDFIKYICSLPDNAELIAYWQKNIKRLRTEGVLSSAGLSLKKRVVLWRFLHKKHKED